MTIAEIALNRLKQGNRRIVAQQQGLNDMLDEILDSRIQSAVEPLLQRQYENKEQVLELSNDA